MNKTKDVGNVIVSEGGSIGRTAGREYKKTMRQDIITNAEHARMLLDRNAAPFIKWQMSKSTGHCITNKARQSIVLRSSHDDSYYGTNSRIHYTYYTKCGGDSLPDLPKLARCDGYGYERGWAFKEAYQQKQMKGQMVPCDNETHAWWKAEDLYRDISEDTARRHFHESMYDIGELANRDDTTGLPGWRDHSKKEAEALIGWEDGVTVMLSNEERSCAESMHANYHKHGNIHGSVKQQVNKKMPQMPQRSDLQRSSETQEGAARELQTSEASGSPVTFDSFLRAAGVTSEHTIIVASNAADNKRSAVLRAVTKATVFSDIIPNGSLRHHDVLYDNTMVNGCPPMTKMLMALFVEKGQHPYQHMNGLSRTIRNALEDMMRKHPTSNVSTAPKDDVLQNKTLLEISEMNVLRWLIRYPLQAVTQDWARINAHLITLNVKLFNATGKSSMVGWCKCPS